MKKKKIMRQLKTGALAKASCIILLFSLLKPWSYNCPFPMWSSGKLAHRLPGRVVLLVQRSIIMEENRAFSSFTATFPSGFVVQTGLGLIIFSIQPFVNGHQVLPQVKYQRIYYLHLHCSHSTGCFCLRCWNRYVLLLLLVLTAYLQTLHTQTKPWT